MQPPPTSTDRELSSWKEIAEHLRVNTRTAQRWEAELGLPVQRLPGAKGRVRANTADLDRWRHGVKEKPARSDSPKFLRAYSVLVTVLVLALIGVITWSQFDRLRRGPPSQFRADQTFQVLDVRGRLLWQKTFPEPFWIYQYYQNSDVRARVPVQFVNIDNDPGTEVLFSYYPKSQQDALICYSESGAEKWRFTTQQKVKDRRREHPPTFGLARFTVADFGAKRKRIVVVFNHLDDHPSRLAVLDGNGRLSGEYWHSGHIVRVATADLDSDGRPEIIALAVNNDRGAVSLLVLDPDNLRGCSQETDGAATQLLGCDPAKEKARLIFPRTCPSRDSEHTWPAWPDGLAVNADSISVKVAQSLESMSTVTYRLNKKLELQDCVWSPRLRELHHQMEREGRVSHHLTEVEEREACKPLVLRSWKSQ